MADPLGESTCFAPARRFTTAGYESYRFSWGLAVRKAFRTLPEGLRIAVLSIRPHPCENLGHTADPRAV